MPEEIHATSNGSTKQREQPVALHEPRCVSSPAERPLSHLHARPKQALPQSRTADRHPRHSLAGETTQSSTARAEDGVCAADTASPQCQTPELAVASLPPRTQTITDPTSSVLKRMEAAGSKAPGRAPNSSPFEHSGVPTERGWKQDNHAEPDLRDSSQCDSDSLAGQIWWVCYSLIHCPTVRMNLFDGYMEIIKETVVAFQLVIEEITGYQFHRQMLEELHSAWFRTLHIEFCDEFQPRRRVSHPPVTYFAPAGGLKEPLLKMLRNMHSLYVTAQRNSAWSAVRKLPTPIVLFLGCMMATAAIEGLQTQDSVERAIKIIAAIIQPDEDWLKYNHQTFPSILGDIIGKNSRLHEKGVPYREYENGPCLRYRLEEMGAIGPLIGDPQYAVTDNEPNISLDFSSLYSGEPVNPFLCPRACESLLTLSTIPHIPFAAILECLPQDSVLPSLKNPFYLESHKRPPNYPLSIYCYPHSLVAHKYCKTLVSSSSQWDNLFGSGTLSNKPCGVMKDITSLPRHISDQSSESMLVQPQQSRFYREVIQSLYRISSTLETANGLRSSNFDLDSLTWSDNQYGIFHYPEAIVNCQSSVNHTRDEKNQLNKENNKSPCGKEKDHSKHSDENLHYKSSFSKGSTLLKDFAPQNLAKTQELPLMNRVASVKVLINNVESDVAPLDEGLSTSHSGVENLQKYKSS